MTVYLAVRWGVFLQGIVGIFDTREAADEAISVAMSDEPDEYHDFEVMEFEMNERRPLPVKGGITDENVAAIAAALASN